MPLEDGQLVCAPHFRFAQALNREPAETPASNVRNSFWSRRWRAVVGIVNGEDGKPHMGFMPGSGNVVDKLLRTLGCSDAWGIEQEAKALQLLAEHIRHRQFKQYLLTGSFMETSPRSGVTYIFRKLRPTVALRARGGSLHMLCALCLHSMAYYDDSWAGAMCPTDDVISHLMLMRGDEVMFWRRSNQIPITRPESGVTC